MLCEKLSFGFCDVFQNELMTAISHSADGRRRIGAENATEMSESVRAHDKP